MIYIKQHFLIFFSTIIVNCFSSSATCSYIVFRGLKATIGLRISKSAEKLGTDHADGGVRGYAIRD